MSTLTEIAQELKDTKEKIILVYAFNATGKTRLSVEYKNITKNLDDGSHAGVYYNAFSEDLFVWDNDEENYNENVKLNIIQSSLNQHHSLLLDTEILQDKLDIYIPRYKFHLNLYEDEDREKGIHSITFYVDDETKKPIKISRGEERTFIWCFFLSLFETETLSNVQDKHYFIDDPVSSMDEHNIFMTAESITKLIDDTYPKKQIILTTHHIGLFSILADRLKKGEKASKYSKDTSILLLENKINEGHKLNNQNGAFLFHLHLLKTLDDATKTELFSYHFVLLRQLLENINSFLGKGGISNVLGQIEMENPNEIGNRINSLSHKDSYKTQSNKMSESKEELFKEILTKINTKYNFKY